MSGSSSYRKAARTYKAIARSSSKYSALGASGSAAKSSSGGASGSSGNVITPGKSSVASAFESYTISRQVSRFLHHLKNKIKIQMQLKLLYLTIWICLLCPKQIKQRYPGSLQTFKY